MTHLQELLTFIGKYKYLKIKCVICEKTFFCSGSCLKKKLDHQDTQSILWGKGCLCYKCDFSSPEFKRGTCKKGEPLMDAIRMIVDNKRRKKHGNKA